MKNKMHNKLWQVSNYQQNRMILHHIAFCSCDVSRNIIRLDDQYRDNQIIIYKLYDKKWKIHDNNKLKK